MRRIPRTAEIVYCKTDVTVVEYVPMPKRTYQPKKRHRSRQHGFFKRMKSRAGKGILKARRIKGRKRLTH